MKFLLTIFICSGISGECYTNPNYPQVYDDHHDCIRAGLSESYEILYAEGNFTKEQINNYNCMLNTLVNLLKTKVK